MAFFDQAVTRSLGFFVAQRGRAVFGEKAHGDAVEKAAAALGAFDPEPVLGGHKPDDAAKLAEAKLRRGFVVDPELTCAAAGLKAHDGKHRLFARKHACLDALGQAARDALAQIREIEKCVRSVHAVLCRCAAWLLPKG